MNGIKRGEIYYAELSPVIGSEQDGNRPAIILQNDKGNLHSRTTIIAAITSELDKARMPAHVIFTVNGMKKKSMVLLEQIRTIDKSRLGNYVGTVDNKTMKQIDHAIKPTCRIVQSWCISICMTAWTRKKRRGRGLTPLQRICLSPEVL